MLAFVREAVAGDCVGELPTIRAAPEASCSFDRNNPILHYASKNAECLTNSHFSGLKFIQMVNYD